MRWTTYYSQSRKQTSFLEAVVLCVKNWRMESLRCRWRENEEFCAKEVGFLKSPHIVWNFIIFKLRCSCSVIVVIYFWRHVWKLHWLGGGSFDERTWTTYKQIWQLNQKACTCVQVSRKWSFVRGAYFWCVFRNLFVLGLGRLKTTISHIRHLWIVLGKCFPNIVL